MRSDDPDYTEFLTRWEHRFHQSCTISGETGAQTSGQRALRRAETLRRQWEDVRNRPFGIAKKAAAVLECAEVRAHARNIADDPDLTNFEHFLISTDVAGRDRVDVPIGPSQGRWTHADDDVDGKSAGQPPDDWGGLDPSPRSNLQMLETDKDEDLDDGVDWDRDDESANSEAPDKDQDR